MLGVRQDPNQDVGSKLLDLLSDQNKSQLALRAIAASLGFSLSLAVAVALLFCFLRPYNSVVYAPRAKYADSKHAPPPVTKGLFAWLPPIIRTKEQDLVDRVGLDAAIFMRVVRMLRSIFTIITVLGCGIILPVNLVAAGKTHYKEDFLYKLTPKYMYMMPNGYWAYVLVAYLMSATILFFLWTNYRQVLRLRKDYFLSDDYQRSLHARTLMVTDIPKDLRSEEGVARITDEIKATHDMPRTVIARNVKDLPNLVEEHAETVKELEGHLAKYLRNPDRLPAKRPTCKPHKSDRTYGPSHKGTRVDAIEYLTGRIKQLENEINEVRQSVDKRNAMSYGFASYDSIPIAHGVAFAARQKAPHNTTVAVAPKPNDLIWKNLGMSRKERSRRNFVNRLWISLLTIVWTAPNILIAVFLSQLSNLGLLWPAFNASLLAYPTWWAIVQGVLVPALNTAFYFYLPAIFRKFCMRAGDVTKSSRERHVTRSLYSFFCFNNLVVFSLFSAVFSWIVVLKNGVNILESKPFYTVVQGLIGVSTYWLSWMLQRNLGAAVDLSQLWTLVWGSFSRRFLSPTPRRMIELSAPQPFDFAGYYNYFLFYATVAITFATVQPLILPVTALYFWMDSFMKKYLILYVFITKYESGGMFWRSIFNRMCFIVIFGVCIIALVIGGLGYVENVDNTHIWSMLGALVPIPLITIGFKIYCKRTFDPEIHYYQRGQAVRDSEVVAGEDGMKKRKGDRVAVRFGHPVLYKPLITPMVTSRSQHLLKSIYTGRTSVDGNTTALAGYSDVYMSNMDAKHPGKAAGLNGPQGWEIVDENNMDFENYKNRPEFRDEAGGDGQLYGRAADLIRPGTPGSMSTGLTRAGTWESSTTGHGRNESGDSQDPYDRSRSESRDSERTRVNEVGGMEYPRGYHQTPSNLREASPAGDHHGGFAPRSMGFARQESRDGLMHTAAPISHSTPGAPFGTTAGGYGPVRYGNTPGESPGYDPNEDMTSYDYFRRGRTGGR